MLTSQKIIRGGYYPNMDLMRYVLAFGVFIAHYNELAGHSVWYFISSFDCVGAFFALSGFLVYGSYEKSKSFRKYCADRARRILPPYFFIVILCALGLAFASSLPLSKYFSVLGFWQYLGANISFLNWLHPDLPGVFVGDEYVLPAVNGSLWTMKVEWSLYLSVPIVIWVINRFGLNRQKTVMVIIVSSVLYRWILISLYDHTGIGLLEILSRQFCGQLAYFYTGVLIYFYKYEFQAHLVKMFLIGLLLFVSVGYIPYGNIFISPVAVSILVLAVSLIKSTPNILRHRHNVSYEMYLFHFPLIQLLIFTGINGLPTYISFAVVVMSTIILSVICHFTICLPFLRRKSQRYN